jgi:hypothetical protein
MCGVSDDGPTSEDATSNGAVVRKPPKKETAVRVRVNVRRLYRDLSAACDR